MLCEKLYKRICLLALTFLIVLTLPASAQMLAGPNAEIFFLRNPQETQESESPDNLPIGLLTGLYVGTSGLEIRPSALIVGGKYQAFLFDAGLRVTPKWFGQPEYLFNLVSPYAVLGGSVSYPWGFGWSAKTGLGISLLQYGSLNAEIGYRLHQFNENMMANGVTISVRATYPF